MARVLTVIAAACVFVAYLPDAARAAADPTAWQELSTAERQAITDNVLRAQGVEAAPYTVQAGTAQNYYPERVSQAIWEGEAEVSRANYAAREFSSSQLRTRIAARVLPKLVPNIGWEAVYSRAIPAVGAFLVGWEIGTGINKLFIDVDVEPVRPTTPDYVLVNYAKDGPLYASTGGFSTTFDPARPSMPVVPQGMLATMFHVGGSWTAANLQTGDGCQDLRPNPANYLSVDGTAYGRCAPEVPAKAFYLDPAFPPVVTRPTETEPAHWPQYGRCCDQPIKTAFPPLPNLGEALAAIESAYESDEAEIDRKVWDWVFANNPPPSDPVYNDPDPPRKPVFDPNAPGSPLTWVVVPEPTPDEAATAYADRVEEAGLVPQVTWRMISDPEVNEDSLGPEAPSPSPGTKVGRGTKVAIRARNPPADDEHNPNCEPPDSSGPNPSVIALPPNGAYELFTGNYPGPIFHAPFEPDTDAPDAPENTTALRYGRAFATEHGGWGGFGWRKIMAKHGWGNAEAVQTEVALVDPLGAGPFPSRQGSDRWVYRSPSYISRTGLQCWWTVVVERDIVDAGAPAPPGIETAYGTKRFPVYETLP